MNTGQRQQQQFNNCFLCGELLGENARTIRIAIGFGDFYEMDYIIVHEDCYNSCDVDLKRELINKLEDTTI